ncbi:AEC family transporter [Arcticibacter tournemirensis]|uniref:AEC family transporter n=1 Tax=Arcticibacter tournemirensis TaxID=699437 RepID=A0A4Q0M3U9_9SPHI|nr:AEC family transporter [Arcticibacter tournemirensis]RXF67597.1 AEC family transporter [Arcticibacter tournemirensis]
MTNFILIAGSLLAGLIFNFSKTLPKGSYRSINAWVLYIALPALSLKYIPAIEWNMDMFFPAIAPVIVWVGAWLSIKIYAHFNPINNATRGCLKLSLGLSNTSFLGFPLIVAYFSERELSIAIISDQVNFILLSTVGIISALRASEKEELSTKVILEKAIKFPPFIAFIAALILPRFIDISPVNPLLDKLIATVGPLALFSIGLQLKFSKWRAEVKNLSFGLIYKLMIAPALVLLVALLFGFKGPVAQISLFEAAMPTLVTGSLLADQYKLNAQLSNLMVGLGILFAFMSTAFWWYVMQLIL